MELNPQCLYGSSRVRRFKGGVKEGWPMAARGAGGYRKRRRQEGGGAERVRSQPLSVGEWWAGIISVHSM